MSKQIKQYNVVPQLSSSKVGTVRYYTRGGRTYMRAASNSVTTNPRTDLQMEGRLKWVSKAVLWQGLKSVLGGAFCYKDRIQSDYNAFMARNVDMGCYMTKGEKERGCQVIMPYQVSEGRLESIGQERTEDSHLATAIALGDLDIDADTPVKNFAAALVQNNESMAYGDEIAFIACLQATDATGMPKVRVKAERVILSREDDRKLWQVVSQAYWTGIEGNLGTGALEAGCYAYIHSRRTKEGLAVSSQSLVAFNDDYIELYTSDEQFQKARDSYGLSRQSFLDSGASAEGGEEPGPVPPPVEKVHLTLTAGTGGSVSPAGETEYDMGESVQITATPSSGWEFLKWSDGNMQNPRTLVMNEDMTLQAQFQEE